MAESLTIEQVKEALENERLVSLDPQGTYPMTLMRVRDKESLGLPLACFVQGNRKMRSGRVEHFSGWVVLAQVFPAAQA